MSSYNIYTMDLQKLREARKLRNQIVVQKLKEVQNIYSTKL